MRHRSSRPTSFHIRLRRAAAAVAGISVVAFVATGLSAVPASASTTPAGPGLSLLSGLTPSGLLSGLLGLLSGLPPRTQPPRTLPILSPPRPGQSPGGHPGRPAGRQEGRVPRRRAVTAETPRDREIPDRGVVHL